MIRLETQAVNSKHDRDRYWMIDVVDKDFLKGYLESHLEPFANEFAHRFVTCRRFVTRGPVGPLHPLQCAGLALRSQSPSESAMLSR